MCGTVAVVINEMLRMRDNADRINIVESVKRAKDMDTDLVTTYVSIWGIIDFVSIAIVSILFQCISCKIN